METLPTRPLHLPVRPCGSRQFAGPCATPPPTGPTTLKRDERRKKDPAARQPTGPTIRTRPERPKPDPASGGPGATGSACKRLRRRSSPTARQWQRLDDTYMDLTSDVTRTRLTVSWLDREIPTEYRNTPAGLTATKVMLQPPADRATAGAVTVEIVSGLLTEDCGTLAGISAADPINSERVTSPVSLRSPKVAWSARSASGIARNETACQASGRSSMLTTNFESGPRVKTLAKTGRESSPLGYGGTRRFPRYTTTSGN